MEAVVIITVLALVQYTVFAFLVGGARQRTGVKAPAASGNEEFERANRVHLNTLEQIVVFLPALWLYAHYVNPLWGAGLGVVYLVGRLLYRSAYLKDPAKRGTGFTLTLLPSVIMLLWVLEVAVMSYF
jgi:uncharacterized membrane protein YecN with MAPEG domain